MLLELETICRDYRGEQQILLISVGISLPVLREQKIKDLSDQEIALPCIGLEVMMLGVVCVVGPFASSTILPCNICSKYSLQNKSFKFWFLIF